MSRADVIVIGGGLAGMAACVHLAKAGLRVLCIEHDKDFSEPVGESLDWSAPDLLKALGLPKEYLISEQIATYKRHVILKLEDGSERHYIPGDWLGRPPFNIDLATLHVDRTRLDEALCAVVRSHGVETIFEKVVEVERDGRRVAAVKTAAGNRFSSPWFIDASGGGASLFPRAFNLRGYNYGPRKVAIWSYFKISEISEGTTLYSSGTMPPYLDWIWEIPVRSDTISVGYVSGGDEIKAKRQQGQTVEDIFRSQLSRFPRFAPLLASGQTIRTSVTSFQCRVHSGVSGPNWVVVGESASMVDPMTSNGVTAALRTAAEASDLILRSRKRGRIPVLAGAMYGRRVLALGRFFNSGIEKVLYDAPIRNRVGALAAGDIYTVPAWSLNTVYPRLRPRGLTATMFYTSLLGTLRASARAYLDFCKWRAPSSGGI